MFKKIYGNSVHNHTLNDIDLHCLVSPLQEQEHAEELSHQQLEGPFGFYVLNGKILLSFDL